jgi:hypothetical protein
MKLLKTIGIVVVLLGLGCTLSIMLSTTSWENGIDFALLLLYLWALLPYIVLVVLTVIIHRRNSSDASRIAIFIASVAVVTLSVLSYYHAMFVSVTSTSALVFVVIPLYALAAIAIFYFVCWMLIRLVRGRASS